MEERELPPYVCTQLTLPWTSVCSWEDTSCCLASGPGPPSPGPGQGTVPPCMLSGALPSLNEGEYIDYQIPVAVHCVFMPLFQYEEYLNQENVAEVWTPHIWELGQWRVLIRFLSPARPEVILHALNHPIY